MKRLIDIDPLTGIQTWHHYDPLTDETVIHEIQDVEPYLERAKQLRNDEDYSKDGIKNSMWHYAHIPAIFVTKLLTEHGLDVFNKDHAKAVFKILNREYPALKTTRGTHV